MNIRQSYNALICGFICALTQFQSNMCSMHWKRACNMFLWYKYATGSLALMTISINFHSQAIWVYLQAEYILKGYNCVKCTKYETCEFCTGRSLASWWQGGLGFNIILASTQETLTLLLANNKGADQPAHLHSMISAFVSCYLKSKVTRSDISYFSIILVGFNMKSLWLRA